MASCKVLGRTVPCVGMVEWSCSDSGLQSGWPGIGPGVPVSVNVRVKTHFWAHAMTMSDEPCAGPLGARHRESLRRCWCRSVPSGQSSGDIGDVCNCFTLDYTQERVRRGWGQVPSEKIIKKISVVRLKGVPSIALLGSDSQASIYHLLCARPCVKTSPATIPLTPPSQPRR